MIFNTDFIKLKLIMKNNIQNIIPKPCLKNWSEMESTLNPLIRKCNLCNKDVFDIRTFNESKINNLFTKNDNNLCAFTETKKLNQIENKKTILKLINNFSLYSFVFVSTLIGTNLQAQNKKKLNTYAIEQKDLMVIEVFKLKISRKKILLLKFLWRNK